MRGKILQYNGNDGTGIIVADGQQYRFTIASWKGDAVPAVGKTVEIVAADGQVQAVTLVADDVLMRERASELGGKLGGLVGDLGSSLAKGSAAGAGAGGAAGSVVDRLGKPTLLAYGIFLIATTMFNALTVAMLGAGWTMFQMADFLSMAGGGGGIKMLLIFSYLSVAVPFFWNDRRAWLALLLPLVTMVWAVIKVTSAGDGGMGGGPGMGDLGIFGFWLPFVAAAFLALTGFRKFTSNA